MTCFARGAKCGAAAASGFGARRERCAQPQALLEQRAERDRAEAESRAAQERPAGETAVRMYSSQRIHRSLNPW